MVGAMPLLLEATVGCDVVFQLQRPDPFDDALECACSCEATAARTQRIALSSDDAQEDAAMAVSLSDNRLEMGEQLVGLRFTGLTIPQGSEIAHAYVEFMGNVDGENAPSSLTIVAEASASPATFSATNGDLSGRAASALSVTWTPIPTFNNGEVQRSPDIGDLLQEAVERPEWNNASAFVLLIDGTGIRTVRSFDRNPDQSPQLIVDLGVEATLPVCAGPDVEFDSAGHITNESLVSECQRVATSLSGLANACGYPTPCSCSLVDARDPSGADRPDSTVADSCEAGCTPQEVDAPACTTFDPNAFADCVANGGTLESCKAQHVSATHASGTTEICVSSGSPLAYQAFGERSLCEVDGTADIVVADRRPKGDPATAGRVEILGRPCTGTGCPIHPYLNLALNPIEFEVRWASNPVFRELAASGRALVAAPSDASGGATFATDELSGGGIGRRGGSGLAVGATNPDPVILGVDWVGRTCSIDGSLSTPTGDDGLCEVDGATPCASDDDCVAVGGGVCTLPPSTDEMIVGLQLFGQIENQPPVAAAGADQSVECTSTAGASFTLDGRGTSDPDANLALTTWHAGSRTGTELSRSPVVAQSLGVGASQSYVLRTVDTFAQTDEDTAAVAVVDTTPPQLAIAVTPTTLWPPNHKFKPIVVTVTTSDVCDASPAIRLVSITSNEPENGTGDGDTAPDIQGAAFDQDDRVFQLRSERKGNGSGRIYTITYEATDDSGNATLSQATVTVSHNN